MKRSTIQKISLLFLILISPSLAFAHPGHLHGLVGGLVHPFTGIDHILGMLSMGAWATLRFNKNKFLLFIIYILGLIVGGVIGINLKILASTDFLIALSIGITSLFILKDSTTKWYVQLFLTMFFSITHGVAHGSEIASLANPVTYIFGFLLSSSILFLLGSYIGNYLKSHSKTKENIAYLLLISAIGLILEI
ncbi:HupE/UreJ family protein [Ferrovum sp. PN-J185]|uniref:HupE/UreJ family protein n=1 Tax=Ferrovum sp. PN-J185 TaxID=1356306 RepID=UPI000797CA99|nr:HupE/UreJ family protein [Ferrovum sp. PN-J185]KXW56934.1 HupE / UreJ protein [Ferrovum sp. PN-J185]MCC6069193.1 HupE/UreJ family protein [Ferrovum sp. PN-J185]MDE1892344.1 HupE/UreJ family protein [Betaproteobacteria bacterium]